MQTTYDTFKKQITGLMKLGYKPISYQDLEDYKNGKDRAVGFLVGQIMKATGGQANPSVTNKILIEELKSR